MAETSLYTDLFVWQDPKKQLICVYFPLYFHDAHFRFPTRLQDFMGVLE